MVHRYNQNFTYQMNEYSINARLLYSFRRTQIIIVADKASNKRKFHKSDSDNCPADEAEDEVQQDEQKKNPRLQFLQVAIMSVQKLPLSGTLRLLLIVVSNNRHFYPSFYYKGKSKRRVMHYIINFRDAKIYTHACTPPIHPHI